MIPKINIGYNLKDWTLPDWVLCSSIVGIIWIIIFLSGVLQVHAQTERPIIVPPLPMYENPANTIEYTRTPEGYWPNGDTTITINDANWSTDFGNCVDISFIMDNKQFNEYYLAVNQTVDGINPISLTIPQQYDVYGIKIHTYYASYDCTNLLYEVGLYYFEYTEHYDQIGNFSLELSFTTRFRPSSTPELITNPTQDIFAGIVLFFITFFGFLFYFRKGVKT